MSSKPSWLRPPWLRVGALVFAHDTFMAAASFFVALYLRVGDIRGYPWNYLLPNALLFTGVAALTFRAMHLYRGMWRYASLNDLVAIVKSVSFAVALYSFLTFTLLTRAEGMPRSLPFIIWLVLLASLGGPRIAYRLFRDGRPDLRGGRGEARQIPTLLVGMGDSAEIFVRAMAQRQGAHYDVVGILDPEQNRSGYRLHGVEVLGALEELDSVVGKLREAGRGVQRIIVSADVPGHRVRAILDAGDRLDLLVSRLPSLTDLKSGSFELRPIAIEDLLNRPEAHLDREGMQRLIAGRRVLVTGAGGSIGSELVRQICSFGPAQIALVDNGEFNLYTIDMEVAQEWGAVPRAAVLADVRDRRKLFAVMKQQRPQLVFHAAALKHVPMVEANPCEGVITNIGGTRNVADAAREAGVAAMVMISTDKAVNPTNVMGATKRAAEAYCQSLDLVESSRTNGMRFITVRFGNVLGSTGSVVPLFQKQLARGGPLTVTHPEIERYFMTIREAVALVLQAAVLRLGIGVMRPATATEARHRHAEAEGGRLFVLDMGEPVKIIDLARQLIRLAGLRPGEDVKIEVTGLRPGEKLREELFHHQEELVPTTFEGINAASPRVADLAVMSAALDGLVEVARAGDEAEVIKRLRGIVPEYAVFVDAAPPSLQVVEG
jgi:O-antigen biosynthesis protein WbqV